MCSLSCFVCGLQVVSPVSFCPLCFIEGNALQHEVYYHSPQFPFVDQSLHHILIYVIREWANFYSATYIIFHPMNCINLKLVHFASETCAISGALFCRCLCVWFTQTLAPGRQLIGHWGNNVVPSSPRREYRSIAIFIINHCKMTANQDKIVLVINWRTVADHSNILELSSGFQFRWPLRNCCFVFVLFRYICWCCVDIIWLLCMNEHEWALISF